MCILLLTLASTFSGCHGGHSITPNKPSLIMPAAPAGLYAFPSSRLQQSTERCLEIVEQRVLQESITTMDARHVQLDTTARVMTRRLSVKPATTRALVPHPAHRALVEHGPIVCLVRLDLHQLIDAETGTQNSSGCKAVQGGYKANASSGATAQVACGVGYYSPGNTDTCTICPAGHYCNAQTTTTPTPCVPGRYAPTTGYGQDCEWCPAGYFNNVYGATSCCKCCSGWFNSQTSQTHCQNCPGLGSSKQGSPPASTSSNQCTFSLTDYVSSCDQPSSGACPPTQATATASSKARRTIRQLHQCPHHSQRRCPVPAVDAKRASHEMEEDIASYGIDTKLGSYECIDIETNLESCGGCVPHGETEGPDGGKDCTAIEHMSAVKCVSGKCTVGTTRVKVTRHVQHVPLELTALPRVVQAVNLSVPATKPTNRWAQLTRPSVPVAHIRGDQQTHARIVPLDTTARVLETLAHLGVVPESTWRRPDVVKASATLVQPAHLTTSMEQHRAANVAQDSTVWEWLRNEDSFIDKDQHPQSDLLHVLPAQCRVARNRVHPPGPRRQANVRLA
ncbi:SubName: Full=Related to GCC2 and GCC3 family protein-Laccaria bicolor {ECO:0000313/EMBL:CCA67194.1} [Serendipita indica DSM 11827]|nr:SubName: Full=Related to GCC2 and GCC3 family protein-Laccaria bicolor {ECO:0000313/EMBL:CCA67194.1} [Serendipita indica DSM 11827]